MGLNRAKKRPPHLFLGFVLSVSILLLPLLSQTVFAVNTTFTYDAVGRLLTAQYGDGQHVAYAYDAVGNMAQLVSNGSGGVGFGAAIIQLLLGNLQTNPYFSVLNQ